MKILSYVYFSIQQATFEKTDSLVTSRVNSKDNLIYVMQWQYKLKNWISKFHFSFEFENTA
jgi:hypothetical protein